MTIPHGSRGGNKRSNQMANIARDVRRGTIATGGFTGESPAHLDFRKFKEQDDREE